MKILFVMDSLGTGGAERSNSYLWYYLLSKGVQLKVIVLEHRKVGIEQEILGAGIDVTFLADKFLIKNVLQIARIARKFGPTLVHSTLFRSNIRTRFAKILFNFFHVESLVNHMYDSARLNDPNVKFWKLKAYQILDRITQLFLVNRFHANGESVKQHYIASLGVKASKIEVVNRGRPRVSDENFDALFYKQSLLAGLNLAQDSFILINVGRHEYQKGQDVLLKSLPDIIPHRSMVLFLVGRDGNFSPQLDQLLDEIKTNIKVIKLGHRNDVHKLLAASDLFIFPSRFEGFPGVLIEAEAASLPIVCSDIVMNLEVVTPNKNALTFKSGDAVDLANKVQELIHSEQMRTAFAKESLKIFNERFEILGIHERMFSFYNQLAGR